MVVQEIIKSVIVPVLSKIDRHVQSAVTPPIPSNALTYTGQPLSFGGDTLTYTEPE
jgi:hypothetical protein